jgi:hypothetical protein
VFEVHSSRKGITLSLDRENILLAFFNGTLGDELKNVRSRLFSLRNIFNLKERQRLQRLYSEIKSLVAVEPLTGIKHLFNHSGVVVGNGPTRGQWFLYPIIDSVPFEPTMVEGDWRQWLRQSPKGKTFLEAMQNSRDKRAYQPISLKDSARMNAAIWVMFGNREKKLQSMGCAFFDLDELQKILNVSDSGELVS